MHHHPTLFFICSVAFEICTGAKAAESYIQNVDAALFVVSTLISPFGMAYLPTTWVIERLLDRSCQKDVRASANGRREFWTFDDIFEEELSSSLGFWGRSKRNASPKASARFVGDFLLGPVYNLCRFLGKLGTSFVSHHPHFLPLFQYLLPTKPCHLVRVIDRQGIPQRWQLLAIHPIILPPIFSPAPLLFSRH